jgi:subtilisin family serine protease
MWWSPRLRRLLGVVVCVVLLGAGWSVRPHKPSGGNGLLLVGAQPGADQAELTGALDAAGARVVDQIPEVDLLVVEPPSGTSAELTRWLRRRADVRYVGADQPLTLTSALSDPLYLDGAQWNLDMIRAPAAWELLPPGGRSEVAVIDTGIDSTHPDLAREVLRTGCNAEARVGCSLSADGTPPRDNNGHGTHVAGIIGADTDNGVGVASVGGGRISILAVRVAPNASPRIDGYRAIAAVIYAVQSGAKVINMSFGAGCANEASPAYRDAIAYAERRDVLLVVAAGNQGGCAEGIYPASDPHVLSVAAVDARNQFPAWSGRGAWVKVAAPGVEIISTYRGGYASLSGTSMATPVVAGVAALLYQVPGATREKVMEWLMQTCEPTGLDVRCGGVINAERAVRLALAGSATP